MARLFALSNATAWKDRGPLLLALSFLILVALSGGASRADSLAQPLVRAISLFYVALLFLFGWADWARARFFWPIFAILLGAIVLSGAQLVPLPPSVWLELPGRAFYAQAADVAGVAQPWRPWNLTPDRGWNALYSLCVPAAMAIGLTSLRRRDLDKLVLPLILLIFVSAVLGLGQISGGAQSGLRWYDVTNRTSAVGLFANRNHDALFLAAALPLLGIWAVAVEYKKKSHARSRALIAAGIGLFLLLMISTTGSRAGLALGLISVVATLFLLAPNLRRLIRRSSRRTRWLLAGAGVASITVMALATFVFDRAVATQRLLGLAAEDDIRFKVLPTVWKMTKEFFPFGAGIGSFDPVYRRFELFENLNFSYLNAAHNDLLQTVFESGLFSLTLLVLALLWWMMATVRLWRMDGATPHMKPARAGSIVILLVVLSSAVDYPARTPLIMTLLVLCAGWMLSALRNSRPLRPLDRSL